VAIFNPQVPDMPDSNYLRWSGGPISQPKEDTTLEALFKGVGDVTGAIAKGGDATIKKTIDDVVYAKADEERNKYQGNLDEAYGKASGQRTAAGDTDVMTANAQAVPSELENVSENLTAMGSSRASGKLSLTEYIMRRDEYLQNIRSQFPGYRQYIDEKAAEATGIPVANALIKARLADINSFIGQAKSETDKVKAYLLRHNELDGVPALIQGIDNGTTTPHQAYKEVNRQLSVLHQLKLRDLLRKDTNETTTQRGIESSKDFQARANQIVTNGFSTLLTGAGIGETPDEVMKKVQAGVDPKESRQLAQTMGLRMLEAEQRMRAEAKIRRPNGTTWYDDIGPDKVEKLIQENLSGYKSVVDFLTNKEYGAAYMVAHDIKSMGDENTRNLLRHPIVGPKLLDLKSIFEQAGPSAVGALAVQSMIEDLPGDIKTYRAETRARADALRVDSKTGEIPSLVDDIKHADAKGVTNPKYYSSLFKQISDITDPTVPDKIKINRFKYAFSKPGAISQIEKDGIDPVTGKPGKVGQYSAYSQLTSDDFIKEAKRLNGLDSTIWPAYTNWVKNTFGNELLKPDVMQLKDIVIPSGLTFGWDTVNTKFSLTNARGQDVLLQRTTGREPGIGNFEKAILNRINGGIQPIARIAKEENADPTFVSNYVLKQLIDLGFDPTIQNPAGVPQHMSKSIYDQKTNQKKYEEELKKKFKKTE